MQDTTVPIISNNQTIALGAGESTMKSLFASHVAPKFLKKTYCSKATRVFKSSGGKSMIWGCWTENPDSETIAYDYDGVSMREYTRVTTIRGDTDLFTLTEVDVDGVNVYRLDGIE